MSLEGGLTVSVADLASFPLDIWTFGASLQLMLLATFLEKSLQNWAHFFSWITFKTLAYSSLFLKLTHLPLNHYILLT